ncbi:hypothetical protein [Streptomyces sp. NPDC015131]|uniref:hypothetical protein n=1 Tax=Streptomyces sp. NPDC015131 TaxID=3364941 RepID=UPI0036FB74C6
MNIPAGRSIVTVPLPGDAVFLLDYAINRAIRRDCRLTFQERIAQMCAAEEIKYGLNGHCLMLNCPCCGGL